ncbi:MAG TPA: SDR family oxidoreductase [Acidimicrobiales bacterium]|jgi:NAD(P)-dependent dehydrogenase (short-subunit alcohol dehydrogenase family)
MDLELRGRVVLVTGGTDGLGLALSRRLVEEGARVALCARDEGRLDAARSEFAGHDVLVARVDVTDGAALDGFVDATLERFGELHGVVSNAGRAVAGPVEDATDEQWLGDFELKVLAAVRLARRCAPHLAASGGAIVNVLAISAKAPDAGTTPTAASRAAGLALTKALSRELGPRGVRVNAILIGLIESGQWERRAASTGADVGEFYRALAQGAKVPLGRVGRASEFADLCTYLLSDRASYVTGAGINLDGGLSPVW